MGEMKLQSYSDIGRKIYRLDNSREARRYYIFLIRSLLNRNGLNNLQKHFCSKPLLQEIQQINPFIYEQPTRAFFYNKSTFKERTEIVKEHFDYLIDRLKPEVIRDIYTKKNLPIWQGEDIDGQQFGAYLYYEDGHRKEGMMSVVLRLDERALYLIVFWIAKDKNGKWAMWIGAMQGPNMDDAKDVVKKITNRCHRYRTKNLILYIAQAVARNLGLEKIYAVTNFGYYANNHVRMDRKLKTSFSDFWQEAGGHSTDDERFDELPLIEPRKTMEEVPTRKRAVYRRRFEFLDNIDASIASAMKNMCLEDN